jgi:hypothetical protein
MGLSTGSEGALLGGVGHRYGTETTLTYNTSRWHQYTMAAFSRDFTDGQYYLYPNNTEVVQKSLGKSVTMTPVTGLKLGALIHGGSPFHGAIQEVLLFDQRLTDSQIQGIYAHLQCKWAG